jgi:DNA-3-methyladenine glycosylase I
MKEKADNCCPWCMGNALMQSYHDTEWGVPLHDERKHFEFLLLETMQAGLSWQTILNKREAFRKAFAGFDVEKVSRFGEEDTARLMDNAGIIRNRRKIEAAISNASAFLHIKKEWGSFDRYIWSFTDGKVVDHRLTSMDQMPVQDELAERISADLKKRGFKFVGAVTIYAHLQAIGVINDHLTHCFRYSELREKP